MRWQRLFEDLEAQAEQSDQASLESEVADRTRREMARVRLVDRLRAGIGRAIVVRVPGLGPLHAVVETVGPDWMLVTERAGTETLVPLGNVLGVTGLGPRSAIPGSEGAVDARLGLAYALRRIARDRSAVVVTVVDGSTVTGAVDRVGADFFELTGPVVRAGRGHDGHAVQTIPFTALGALRRSV